MSHPRIPFETEYLFSLRGALQPPELIGPVPEGIRATFYFSGGEVAGPRLQGTMKAAGGDWLTLRSDGVAVLDVRGTIETNDGALIQVSYQGLSDFGTEGYAAFLRGEVPTLPALRTTPQFRTAHPDYQWLHRLLCVGIGVADLDRQEVRYDIYAIR